MCRGRYTVRVFSQIFILGILIGSVVASPVVATTPNSAADFNTTDVSTTVTVDRSTGNASTIHLTYRITPHRDRDSIGLWLYDVPGQHTEVKRATNAKFEPESTSYIHSRIILTGDGPAKITLIVTAAGGEDSTVELRDSWVGLTNPIQGGTQTVSNTTVTSAGDDTVVYNDRQIIAGAINTTTTTIDGQPITVVSTANTARSPDELTRYLDGISYARSRFHIDQTHPVTVVFMEGISGWEDGYTEQSVMFIDSSGEASDEKRIVVHEYVHATQTFTDDTTPQTEWLVEATAEYIATSYEIYGPTDTSTSLNERANHAYRKEYTGKVTKATLSEQHTWDRVTPYAIGRAALINLNRRLVTAQTESTVTVSDIYAELQRLGDRDRKITLSRVSSIITDQSSGTVDGETWVSDTVTSPYSADSAAPTPSALAVGVLQRPYADPDGDGTTRFQEATNVEVTTATPTNERLTSTQNTAPPGSTSETTPDDETSSSAGLPTLILTLLWALVKAIGLLAWELTQQLLHPEQRTQEGIALLVTIGTLTTSAVFTYLMRR